VAVPDLDLNSGHTIPQLGFGVFKIDPPKTAAAVTEALRVGYRHIDTAEMYRNEREVGEAVRTSGLDRSEVYLTSKLNNGFHQPDDARRAFDGTLEALGSDYLDLFLIHWPLPTLYDGDFVSTWLTLQEFYRDGRARSIGVSNFQIPHLQRLIQESDVVPAVNQIELHPYFQQTALQSLHAENNIATQAWSPIGGITSYRDAAKSTFDDPTLLEVARQRGKSAAQVMLRWHLQERRSAIPKSTKPARIAENFDVFDFELTSEEIAAIDALDTGVRGGPDTDSITLEAFGREIPEA